MSNTEIKLGGGVDVPFTPETLRATGAQVLIQGLGFPLRRIDNVPPVNSGEVLNEDTVAIGEPMLFMRQGWEQGKFHTSGNVVTNGLWTMVSNKLTLGNPYPQPDGDPTFTLPSFTPLVESDTSVIESGHVWTFTDNALVTAMRVWVTSVTANSHYQIRIVISTPGFPPRTLTILNPVLTAGEWTIIALINELFVSGTTIAVVLQAYESLGGSPVTGPWGRESDSNNAEPSIGNWRTRSNRAQVRINKTDNNFLNRAAELATIGIDSTMTFTQNDDPQKLVSFSTTSIPTDLGNSFQWEVVKILEGTGGEPDEGKISDVAITVPTVLVTEYAEELTGLAAPAWGTVVPILQFDDVDQSPAADTAFGVDIEGDITVFSEDWDVLSFQG